MLMRDEFLLNLFNFCLAKNFGVQVSLNMKDLRANQKDLKLNVDIADVFDAMLDVVVYAVGACTKLAVINNDPLVLHVNSIDEKKMVQRIANWNEVRNLHIFNFRRELAFIVEEVYEGTYIPHKNSHLVSFIIVDQYFRDLIAKYQSNYKLLQQFFTDVYKTFMFWGQKLANSFVKQNFFYYMDEVMNANDTKGNKTDSEGKIVKDTKTFSQPQTKFELR